MNKEAAKLIFLEMSHAGLTADMEKMLNRLESRRITPEKELPKMEFLFTLFQKPCFPRGELVAISGKAKSGKTFVSSILMALCFRDEVLSVKRNCPGMLRVLWYDTEQSEESTQDILRHRIIPMTGMDEQSFPMKLFDIFNVRADMYNDRLPMLEVAVNHYHPDLVILDGIRDLITDINDGVVAQDCLERLMHLASANRCCIVCVLHQNKSAEDKNLRGWIGTELKNKGFEVYECFKSSERIFSWTQTDTRKYDILGKLQFAVNDEGIPYLCTHEQLTEALYNAQRSQYEEQNAKDKRTGKLPRLNPKYVLGREDGKPVFDLKRLFNDCMEPDRTYTENELGKRVCEIANIMTNGLCNHLLQKAVSQKVIIEQIDKDGKRGYKRPIMQATLEFPKDPQPDFHGEGFKPPYETPPLGGGVV
jgi:hypothetical protein